MEIHKATLEDIEDLITIRLDFLREEHPDLDKEMEEAISLQLKKYFSLHILSGNCICRVIRSTGQIMAAGFLVIDERPANLSCTSGITGTILNVFTYPEHRRKGYARKIMLRLIEDAREKGATLIDLNATDKGKRLYEELGFRQVNYTAMRLKDISQNNIN